MNSVACPVRAAALPSPKTGRRDHPRPGLFEGFTLVEIMIVVVIIGLLAALATVTIAKVKAHSANTAAVNDLRTFAAAFEQYCLEYGAWPPDGAAGVVPTGMEDRINTTAWGKPTPGNGRWDWDNSSFLGIHAGISWFGSTLTDTELAKIDALIDDGNVHTGRFRRLSDGRPCYVLED